MFQVSTTPIIRSTQMCNYSLQYWSYFLCSYLPPAWHAGRTPEWTCRIINKLLCVASRWTIINIYPSVRVLALMWETTSIPLQNKGIIIRLGISVFMLLDSRLEHRSSWAKWQQSFPKYNLFWISSWIWTWFVVFLFQIFDFVTLPEEMLTSFVLIMLFCPKFSSSDMNIYLVSSTLTSRTIYLQVTKKASVSYLFCTQ